MYPGLETVYNFSMARSQYIVYAPYAPWVGALLQDIASNLRKNRDTFVLLMSYPSIWNWLICQILGWYRKMCPSEVLWFRISWTWQTQWQSLYWNDKRLQNWMFIPNLNDPTVNMKLFQEFSAKLRMRIGSLVLLVVTIFTLCMYLLKQVLKNLNKPWRNFSYIHFGTYMTLHNTPARRADYVTESSTYPRSFCPTWYGLFGLPLLYLKNVLLHVDLTLF